MTSSENNISEPEVGKCTDVEDAFGAVLSGDFTREEFKRANAHLGKCSECRAAYADLSAFRKEFTRAYSVKLAEGNHEGRVENRRMMRFSIKRRWAAGMTLAAACVAVLVVTLIVERNEFVSSGAREGSESAAAASALVSLSASTPSSNDPVQTILQPEIIAVRGALPTGTIPGHRIVGTRATRVTSATAARDNAVVDEQMLSELSDEELDLIIAVS